MTTALSPGIILGGRFEIDKLIGRGTLGTIYRARDVESDARVALRVFSEALSQADTLLQELRTQARTAASLSHNSIAPVFAFGRDNEIAYMAMEYIDGLSLRTMIARKRSEGSEFSTKGIYNLIAHLCNALSYAHETMIHGLPGPGSVFVSEKGRVKLTDFGLTTTLLLVPRLFDKLGDAYCLAPELAADSEALSPAADVYSLGVVLHELFWGCAPGATPNGPAPTTTVQKTIARCLDPDPSLRYRSPADLKAALRAAVSGPSPAAEADEVPSANTRGEMNAASERPPAADNAPVMTGNKSGLSPLWQPESGQQPKRIEDFLADPNDDPSEHWLIQKGKLDFGPFSIGDIKRRLYSGELSESDLLVDQETGGRTPMHKHPLLREFVALLMQHNVRRADRQQEEKQTRRRTTVALLGIVSLLALVTVAGIGVYIYARGRDEPIERTKVVYRDRTDLKGIEIVWKKEPREQARHRRRLQRKRRTGTKARTSSQSDDITHLGDASKSGGDELLSERDIQRVMEKNMQSLTGCVLAELRKNRDLGHVTIEFGVKGSGKVGKVKVNKQTAGRFQECIARKMRSISFPSFDGALTRASFDIRLQH